MKFRPTLSLNRYSAASLHFLISCLTFLIFISILLLLWYPAPYFSASGGWQGLQLVILVDLVLGPSLTLIVYNSRKSRRELLFDFSLIAIIQMSALIWGIMSVYEQRPVAAVYWSGSFYTVPASSLISQGENLQQLERFGPQQPVYTYAQPPVAEAEHQAMLEGMAKTKTPPHEQPQRYRPLGEHFIDIRRGSIDIEEVISANADMRDELAEILEDTGTTKEDNYYIPLISRYRNIILVFSNENELLGMLNAPLKEGPQ